MLVLPALHHQSSHSDAAQGAVNVNIKSWISTVHSLVDGSQSSHSGWPSALSRMPYKSAKCRDGAACKREYWQGVGVPAGQQRVAAAATALLRALPCKEELCINGAKLHPLRWGQHDALRKLHPSLACA